MAIHNPVPSTEPFILADKFVDLIMGPVGSTKTTASLLKIVHEAGRVAPCPDGVRRSRIAIVRNTREQLWDTTIPDFLKMYGEYGIMQKTGARFILKIADIEAECLFRGLDDANDVRRLLSLQLSFGMLDEFREIHKDIFEALTGRLGRYPDKTMNGVGCCDVSGHQIDKVWGASNPPDADSFWEDYISELPSNAHVTIQPSGRSPEADWLHCLKDGYYENLCHGKDDAWIAVYVDGKFGQSLAGKPVFRCFDRDTHVAKGQIALMASPLIIGVDAGLNPSAVLTQQTYDGRVLVHDAITGNEGGMGALRFIREKLKPLLNNKYRSVQSVGVVIDPAAVARAQTDEKSVMDIFKAEGFAVVPAPTNTIAARLAAVENYLTRSVNGKSGMLISPESGLLTRALAGMYRYKTNSKGITDDTPDKNHPFSDIADALQYACLHHDGGKMFGKMMAKRRTVTQARAGGWT